MSANLVPQPPLHPTHQFWNSEALIVCSIGATSFANGILGTELSIPIPRTPSIQSESVSDIAAEPWYFHGLSHVIIFDPAAVTESAVSLRSPALPHNDF
jgi:hypothetical protein